MIYGHILLLGLLVFVTFWRRDIFFYIICAPVAITTGLYWYDVFTVPAGMVMALVLIGIGLYSLALAVANLIRR